MSTRKVEVECFNCGCTACLEVEIDVDKSVAALQREIRILKQKLRDRPTQEEVDARVAKLEASNAENAKQAVFWREKNRETLRQWDLSLKGETT